MVRVVGVGGWVAVTTVLALRPLAAQSEISVLPDSVIAGRDGSRPVLVVIRNSSDTAWTEVRVACVAPGAIGCVLEPGVPDRVAPHGALSRRLSVTDSLGTGAPGVILLRLDYQSKGRVGIATAGIRLVMGRFPRPEDAASIELAGSLTSLSDQDSALIYLSVRNLTDGAMTVMSPRVRTPGFLTATADSVGAAATGAAGTASLIPIVVRTTERVHPGKATLHFVIPIRWKSGVRALEGEVVLSKELDIGVTGVSEILKVLGLPSLLFLPGALVLLTVMVLWRLRAPPGKGDGAFPFPAASGEFLVLSVTISLAGVFVGRLWNGANYLRFYGLVDVFYLWMFAIGLGVVLYLFVLAVGIHREREARRRDRLMNLSRADDAVTALEKVARAGRRSLLFEVVYVEGAKDEELFRLGQDPKDADVTLLAPKIEVAIDEVSDEAKELNRLLSRDRVPEIANFLRSLVDSQKAKANWRGGVGVRPAPTGKLTPVGRERWVLI